jgi:hypothetical protein
MEGRLEEGSSLSPEVRRPDIEWASAPLPSGASPMLRAVISELILQGAKQGGGQVVRRACGQFEKACEAVCWQAGCACPQPQP